MQNQNLELFLVFLAFFLVFWWVIMRLLRHIARMATSLDFDPGPPLRESGWGSANINNVHANRCIKLVEYAAGWVLKMRRVFGNGILWLPKSQIEIDSVRQATFFRPRQISLRIGTDRVDLYGKLADFFECVRTRFRFGNRMAWFGIVFIAVIILCEAVYGWKTAVLASHGEKVWGTVTSTDCRNHNAFHYQFDVERMSFQGTASASTIRRRCEDLRAGDPVQVHYLPSDPSISLPGDARDHFLSAQAGTLLSALGLAGFVFFLHE